MTDLLTTREVKELLKLDRTTIYRMLKQGRLSGVRVGQQWRFTRQAVEALLRGEHAGEPAPVPEQPAAAPGALAVDILPLHCVQPIQDVFAELAHVGELVMFASDHPHAHGGQADALVEVLDDDAREAVLRGNATAFFGLAQVLGRPEADRSSQDAGLDAPRR